VVPINCSDICIGNKSEAGRQLVVSDEMNTHKQPIISDGTDAHEQLMNSDGVDTHRTIQQLCERIHQLEAVSLLFFLSC